MTLFTKAQFDQLLDNGRTRDADNVPVVRLFIPETRCIWLFTEIDPVEPDIAFGLCDLGAGRPELGSVSIRDLLGVRARMGLRVERDQTFTGKYPLYVYAEAARRTQAITVDDRFLQQAAIAFKIH